LACGGKARLPEHVFTAYRKITNSSRISRYLSNDGENTKAVLLSEKDLIKALSALDILISYFAGRYTFEAISCKFSCKEKGNHSFQAIIVS